MGVIYLYIYGWGLRVRCYHWQCSLGKTTEKYAQCRWDKVDRRGVKTWGDLILDNYFNLNSQSLQNTHRMGNEQICRNCKEQQYDHSALVKHIQTRTIINVLPHTQLTKVQRYPKEESRKLQQKTDELQLESVDFKGNSTKEDHSLEVPQLVRLFTGKTKVQYETGWIYAGDLVNGIREGYGRMTWPNGDFYQGIFHNGKAHGHGVFELTNGIKYEGQFANDEITLGKRVTADEREVYEGAFKNKQFDGYGTLKVRDEFEYKGLFRKNQIEGPGRIRYNDGSEYVGEFKNGKKHGYGLWVSFNNSRYEGYWLQGQRDGPGVFITKQGQRKQKRFERGRQLAL